MSQVYHNILFPILGKYAKEDEKWIVRAIPNVPPNWREAWVPRNIGNKIRQDCRSGKGLCVRGPRLKTDECVLRCQGGRCSLTLFIGFGVHLDPGGYIKSCM